MLFKTNQTDKIEYVRRNRKKDFINYIKKYCFEIQEAKGQPDINSVSYKGKIHLFSVPSGAIYDTEYDWYKSMEGMKQPSYGKLIMKADAYAKKIKGGYIREHEAIEKEMRWHEQHLGRVDGLEQAGG